jgi:hypothetical protein
MGAPERDLINSRLASLQPHERRFRINAGLAWTGEIVRRTRTTITLRNPRPFHAAPPGWPDLAGWDSVSVTPEMVGQLVAVFAAEEMKTGRQRLSRLQRLFRDCLLRMGGEYRIIRSFPPSP